MPLQRLFSIEISRNRRLYSELSFIARALIILKSKASAITLEIITKFLVILKYVRNILRRYYKIDNNKSYS
jgi:hypothetical protein